MDSAALTANRESSEPTTTLVESTGLASFGRFTSEGVMYGLGAFVGRAMGLALLPVLTRALSPSEFGFLDVLWAVGSGLAGVLLLGLDAAALRLYFDRHSRFERAQLMSTWAVLLGVTALTSALAIIVASETTNGVLVDPSGDSAPILALALVVPAALLNQLVLTILRATARPASYALVSVFSFVAYGLAVLALALDGAASIGSILVAWGLALSASTSLGLIVCRGAFVRSFERGDARDLVRLGLPLAPIVAAGLAAEFVLRATLLGAAGAAAVAQLSIAIRLASILMLVVVSLQLAWQPRVYAMGESSGALDRMARDGQSLIALVAVLATGLALVMPTLIPVLAGPGYERSIPTVGWCLAAVALAAAVVVASTPSAIVKRPADLTISTVVGFAVTVIAGLALTPSLDSVGAGFALLAGQASTLFTLIVVGRRRLDVPLPWLATLGRLGVTVVAVVSIVLPWPSFAARAAIAAVAIGVWAFDPVIRAHVAGTIAWARGHWR
jgi:O-antigen/teichoic acid export membrane protein